jgi:hypothetical protein
MAAQQVYKYKQSRRWFICHLQMQQALMEIAGSRAKIRTAAEWEATGPVPAPEVIVYALLVKQK